MDFKITGLPVVEFAHLFALDAATLQRKGIVRVVADEPQAFPCRITLEDADPGDSLLLLTYAHQAARTPYAASGPIFVRCAAEATRVSINEVPAQQRCFCPCARTMRRTRSSTPKLHRVLSSKR